MSDTVLFVDGEQNTLQTLKGLFADDREISVVTATDRESARETLIDNTVDLVISDRLTPENDGVELLAEVRKSYPDVSIMLMADEAATEVEDAIARLGEDLTVLKKSWNDRQLQKKIRDALSLRALVRDESALIRYGGLTPAQLERAQRVRSRMRKPVPLGEVLVELGEITRKGFERVERQRRSKLSLAALLQEDGHLTDEDLATYRDAKRADPDTGERELLVGNNLITEEHFLQAIAVQRGIPYVEPDIGEIDSRILGRASFPYLLKHNVVPIRIEGGKIQAIVSDPLDNHLLLELERIFGLPVDPRCCASDKIKESLQALDRLRGDEREDYETSLQYREIEDLPDGEETGREAVQIVDYLLLRAIQLGASDLHIEPFQNKIQIRVRVDGVLQKLTDLPIDTASRLASRIKILAGADIAEKRLHQDGKIFVKIEGSEVDIRVSTYVSVYGETIVLRLLDRNKNLMTVDSLGFAPKIRELMEEIVVRSSSGLVLVTGPTGSGKTTTLYSLVEHALDPTQKVITCEDPVEYVLDGVTQCSVNQKTGPTFSDSLKSIVRQDPDTILVGEIRDPVTASLAVESALTGHKVYSTFHTEDSASVVIRLLEMGVEPFLVSSTLATVVAQRLIRRLCTKCRKPGEPSRSDLRFLNLERSDLRGIRLYESKGCTHCGGSGYKGRLGIHEVLVPDDDFRDAVIQRASAKDLRALAKNLPEFLSLQEDALLKAVSGVTSISEIVAKAPRDIHGRSFSILKNIAGIGRKK